jgi:hypothetical protein
MDDDPEKQNQATVSDFLANEQADERSQKMSDMIRVQRWPGEFAVIGPSLLMLSVDKAAESLANSGFMVPWIIEQIKSHLLSGGLFTNRGRGKVIGEEPAIVPNGEALYLRVRSEYRLATELEVLNWVDSTEFSSATGRKISRRAQEKGYTLHYHEDVDLIKAYDHLPRQAKVVLDILNEAGRESFTEASINVLLSEATSIERLGTRQDPMSIFAYYRKRLVDEGHIEEVGDGGADVATTDDE